MSLICVWIRRRFRLSARNRNKHPSQTAPIPAPFIDLKSGTVTPDTLDTPNPSRDVLSLALTTLSAVSANSALGGILSSVIDSLLAITKRIEHTSANTKSFLEFATRIDRITPIITQLAQDEPERGRKVVEALQRELKSITNDLEAASAQGRLNDFLSENSSCLVKHNMALTQIIADSTFATVQDVLASLHDLEHTKFRQLPSEEKPTELAAITGGFGGAGGQGRMGGEGGEGCGPELDIDPDERLKVGNISGGQGGTGGLGQEVGGKGGIGRGPVINVSRRHKAMVAQAQPPLAEQESSIL
ncbi:hypothetical protein C8R46DRAFT_1359787 [Mycena filopes]|nr:hypothetical protein C8R46DRAFT_1359787 [Mycena filopes]